MQLDMDAKKHTLRLLHHNVGVVSSGKEEKCVGATVTWFTQSSFEPPIVTLAIKADSRLYSAVKANNALVVSLVAKDDKETAGAFFKPGEWSETGFGGFPAKPHPSGGAILDSSPAWFAGDVIKIVEEGDHHIVMIKIVDAGVHDKNKKAMCLSETGWKYGG